MTFEAINNFDLMKTSYKPKVVMSIHGYLSNGVWQKTLTSAIQNQGLISLEFNYGWIIRFDKRKQAALVEKFKDWYFQTCLKQKGTIKLEEPFHRPSIVAHSLGSWIIAKALQKYPEIKFDKIFLYGAIIPRDYDWLKLILNDQVGKVICEISQKDVVIRFSYFVTGSFFPCSRYRFTQGSSYIKYVNVDLFEHSDFQYVEHFESQLARHLYDEPTQLKVVQGSEISISKLKSYFKQTLLIDEHVYGSEYVQNSPVTIERALKWAAIEKGIWSFIVNAYTDKVVGYVNCLALENGAYAKYINGKLEENEIRSEYLVSFDTHQDLNIIVMSIALDQHTFNKEGSLVNSRQGELLLAVLSNKILQITNKGRKLESVAAIAWTGVGENISKSFGLQKTTNTYRNHPIYELKRSDLLKIDSSRIRTICKWWIDQLKKN